MRERTRFKNKIRAELAKRGIRILKNTFAKRRAAPLRELGIKAVDECLTMIRALNERIKGVSDELKRRAEENEDAKLLMTIPGVGYFSALAISAEIGDISRFSNAEKTVQLCGTCSIDPSIRFDETVRFDNQTGQQDTSLEIQECMWVHLQYDTHISRFFYRLASKKGKKNRRRGGDKAASGDLLDAHPKRKVSRLKGRGYLDR